MRLRPLLALAALLAAGCATPTREPFAEQAFAANGWSLTDTQGETWTNGSLEGRPALLFFMATWCSTCRATAPAIAQLHDEYGERVQFLSVGFDPTESPEDLERWKRERAQPWPHGLDASQTLSRAYDVRVQSWVVVLDSAGDVAFSKHNPPEDAARDALEAALDAGAA